MAILSPVPHRLLDRPTLLESFRLLDTEIPSAARLILGGGAAMVAAYGHTLATRDVDATTTKGSLSMADLDAAAKRVARRLDLEPDWLNPYFDVYTPVLPPDYATRLRRVYDGKNLRVDALGPEDLLVMKCFAGRDKDRPHARRLLRLAKDLDVVDRRLGELLEARYPGAERAADAFDDLKDDLEP
jgi:hypothetical protein